MSSTAAERMRLYRKRRRDGMHYVRVPLHVTEIDDEPRWVPVGVMAPIG
jgi:hypothetical protein